MNNRMGFFFVGMLVIFLKLCFLERINFGANEQSVSVKMSNR